MAKSWQEFEKLAARIERLLAPGGAQVKTPDWIPDRVTGQPREVDASIRYTIGSVTVLITVECRKRGKVQDSTWIEQLATKKNDVGASHTIAVTHKGLSEPAIQKARNYGIEVRQIKEVSDADILAWANQFILTQGTCRISMHGFPSIRLHSSGQSSGVVARPEVEELLRQQGVFARIFVYAKDPGIKLSIGDVICILDGGKAQGEVLGEARSVTLPPGATVGIGVDPLFDILSKGIDRTKPETPRHFHYSFPTGQLQLQDAGGAMHDVAQLSFDADVVFFFETISDPIKTYDYSSPDEPIAQVAESTLTLKRGPESYAVRTSRIRRADDTDQPREP